MRRRLITRRRFFVASAAGLCSGLGVFGYTWRIEPHWVDVVERPLPIKHLPAGLVGKRLIHISDLHIGPVVDSRYIIACLERINSMKPDFLVITGDFMTCCDEAQIAAATNVLGHLRPPALATVAVLGNHDYGTRWGSGKIADCLTRELESLDINVLRNDTRTLEGLTFAGIDDYWSPNFNPGPMLSKLPKEQANLVLCHNPDVADEPHWHDYTGWILCGHTHGGQCKPPFLAPPILPVKNKRYCAGEIDLHDGRRMYINRGLGYLHRVRFNVRPEITVFTLA